MMMGLFASLKPSNKDRLGFSAVVTKVRRRGDDFYEKDNPTERGNSPKISDDGTNSTCLNSEIDSEYSNISPCRSDEAVTFGSGDSIQRNCSIDNISNVPNTISIPVSSRSDYREEREECEEISSNASHRSICNDSRDDSLEHMSDTSHLSALNLSDSRRHAVEQISRVSTGTSRPRTKALPLKEIRRSSSEKSKLYVHVYHKKLTNIQEGGNETAWASNSTCPIVSTNAPCILIKSWSDFEVAVSTSDEDKDRLSSFILNGQITLACQKQNECIISSTTKIFKIQGAKAQVTISGFSFHQSGTSNRATIHIKSIQSESAQLLCFCHFESSNGRGAAVTSEAETITDIISSTFYWSSGSVIFNRGFLHIEGSSFYKDSGIIVRSSSGSKTSLKENIFTAVNSTKTLELFRNKGAFDDFGGNEATGMFNCIGIRLPLEDRCIGFRKGVESYENTLVDFKESSSSKSTTISSKMLSACSRLVKDDVTCIPVSKFSDLRHAVHKASPGSTLVFCSFTVSKPHDEILYIEKELSIGCAGGKCTISGPGEHFKVRNKTKQAIVQGIVFEGSTNTALHVLPFTELIVCDCTFSNNHGFSIRGSAFLAERETKVHIEDCHFENNSSSDIGGSIFTRGIMMIHKSSFRNNKGVGSAIAVAPKSTLSIFNSEFYENTGGPPIFFHERTVFDLGRNTAIDNSVCNGILIQREKNACLPFKSDSKQTEAPSLLPSDNPIISVNLNKKRETVGYFNYDPNDEAYGPLHWGSVQNNSEYRRYVELSDTLQRSLVNKCERKDVLQSPIDICEDKINAECFEHHQTRTHEGNMMFGDIIEAQILPSKLRLKYHTDRTPEGGPYPPEGDFAHNWNGYAEVNHIDVKIPSEHTHCGKRFSAEYQIFMLHPKRRQTIVMSILLDIDPTEKDNTHFQLIIDEWQKTYDMNAVNCDPSYISRFLQNETNNSNRALIADNTPFGIGGWDPFHPSLETTIYHWGYWGSLTEAPCSNFVAWRILTKPALISQKQLDQMKNILFTNVDDKCELTTVNFMDSVARPIQDFKDRPLYKCSSRDYVSDAEKARIRKETGNPNWCC